MSRPRSRQAILVASLTVMAIGRLPAQSDTVTPPRRLFTWGDALLAGGFAGMTVASFPLDKRAAERLQRPETQESRLLQRAAKGFNLVVMPGTLIIGTSMYAVGRITRSHRVADLALHGTEALVIGEGLGVAMKGFFGRQRPYMDPVNLNPDNWQLFRGYGKNDGYRSFPSGHTVAAFAVAAAVTAETSRWWENSRYVVGPVMYGGAGMAGLSRMYNNRHWASDVLVGAAIGTFAGNKVVRYHHSHPGNVIDEWLVNFSIAPTATGHTLNASILPRLRPIARRR
jgi:membrane-associated phospholipid phosphatase